MKREINSEKGFTLIEVLVAVFLLAIGMMSAASMQSTAISGNKFSKDTSLAIELAEEMVDRIRINSGKEPHKYHNIDTSGDCTGSDPKLGDCKQWKLRMEDDNLGLANAIGTVTVEPVTPTSDWSNGVPVPYTATITVNVSWDSGGANYWMRKPRSIEIKTIKVTGWVDNG